MHARPPHLQDVLADVRRGRVAYICLTREQKKALRDPEARIALDVLRHLLGARPMTPEHSPLTEQTFQAVARRLGYVVGKKRCRRMVRRLSTSGVVVRCGHYRQPYRNSAARSGFRVSLYKLGHRLRAPRIDKRKRPVGRHAPVKADVRPRWWQVPLFGAFSGFLRRRYRARRRGG
jgi:DNA-binding Lrp family transcriptional regulator